MNDKTNKINSLPSVDISKFFSGSPRDKQEVAQQVAKACREVGFLLISGHGISESQQEALKTKTFDFFDLPLKEKQKWGPIGSAKQRGYSSCMMHSILKCYKISHFMQHPFLSLQC